jgi:hypothetical protein
MCVSRLLLLPKRSLQQSLVQFEDVAVVFAGRVSIDARGKPWQQLVVAKNRSVVRVAFVISTCVLVIIFAFSSRVILTFCDCYIYLLLDGNVRDVIKRVQ